MDLRQQIVNELKMQLQANYDEIDELNDEIDGEKLVMSTQNGGGLSRVSRNACKMRILNAENRKSIYLKHNEWIDEMLNKYEILNKYR